jgi:hypothetical protein
MEEKDSGVDPETRRAIKGYLQRRIGDKGEVKLLLQILCDDAQGDSAQLNDWLLKQYSRDAEEYLDELYDHFGSYARVEGYLIEQRVFEQKEDDEPKNFHRMVAARQAVDEKGLREQRVKIFDMAAIKLEKAIYSLSYKLNNPSSERDRSMPVYVTSSRVPLSPVEETRKIVGEALKAWMESMSPVEMATGVAASLQQELANSVDPVRLFAESIYPIGAGSGADLSKILSEEVKDLWDKVKRIKNVQDPHGIGWINNLPERGKPSDG